MCVNRTLAWYMVQTALAIAFMMAGCSACWVISHEPQKSQERKQQTVLADQWKHCCLCNAWPFHHKQALWENPIGYGKGVSIIIFIFFVDIKLTDPLIAYTYYWSVCFSGLGSLIETTFLFNVERHISTIDTSNYTIKKDHCKRFGNRQTMERQRELAIQL